MPFGLPPVKSISSLLVLSALLCAGSGSLASAQENPLRIGAHVDLDDQWAKRATEENRAFVEVLRAQTASGSIETLPNDRLYHLYRTEKLDCILTGGWPSDDPQLRAKQALVFEVRLFILSNTDLFCKGSSSGGAHEAVRAPCHPT